MASPPARSRRSTGRSTTLSMRWTRPPRETLRGGMLQRFHEGREVVPSIVPGAVDEEGRRAIDAAPHSAHEILAHPGPVGATLELGAHPPTVEAQLLGILHEMLIVEGPLPLEEQVVHWPELPLSARCLGGLRGMLGLGVNLGKGEVAEHEPQSRP